MLRSMYSGISGLKVNQAKLDVVGNNIANASTTAYKYQSIKFQDMMSQTITEATGPSLNLGGMNAKQVGLGVKIGGIDTSTSQGGVQTTGRNLDTMVDGNGYFMVAKGNAVYASDNGISVDKATSTIGDLKNMNLNYTRDGSFNLDSDGNLLTSSGLRVLGYAVTGAGGVGDSITDVDSKPVVNYVPGDAKDLVAKDNLQTLVIPESVVTANGPQKVIRFSIENDGLLKATLEDGKISVIGQIALATFKNPAGLTKLGNNLLQGSVNSGEPIIRTGVNVADPNAGNSKGFGAVVQGALEMSNVDLAEQFTDMIVASRAFQANGKIITTGDEILQDLVNLKR